MFIDRHVAAASEWQRRMCSFRSSDKANNVFWGFFYVPSLSVLEALRPLERSARPQSYKCTLKNGGEGTPLDARQLQSKAAKSKRHWLRQWHRLIPSLSLSPPRNARKNEHLCGGFEIVHFDKSCNNHHQHAKLWWNGFVVEDQLYLMDDVRLYMQGKAALLWGIQELMLLAAMAKLTINQSQKTKPKHNTGVCQVWSEAVIHPA